MMFSEAQLLELKARNPVHKLAGEWVRLRRGGKFGYRGPCPLCSRDLASRRTSKFECDAERWVCAACGDGGDVIALVMRHDGKDFAGAVEWLGGTREVDPVQAKAEEAARAIKRAEQERQALVYRERERARLFAMWEAAKPWADWRTVLGDDRLRPGTPVEAYFAGRGLIAPRNARLRWHPDMPLFADGREVEPRVLHRGAAMLAAIIAPNVPALHPDGPGFRFSGLHITWLDPAGPKGKLALVDPETGEAVPAKKSRGSKAGGYIDLGGSAEASRMVAGEGIETVLAVHTALARAGKDLRSTSFRCGIDLGNLAGRATETVQHPTLKTANGRARRVPGREPDMESPAMPVPACVTDLVLLGDGDSDPFTTQCAMERATKRHARPGRTVRVLWARPGLDFNDMLNAGGVAE
jgi:hypothetical protein